MTKEFIRLCITALLIMISVPSTFSAVSAGELTVSAAVSLKNAFGELGKLYEAKSKGTKVVLNFGASGDLAKQIEGGAPVDVFASAARKDMDELEKKGAIIRDSRVNFSANSVVLIVPAEAKPPIDSFEDLKGANIKKIAVGNPKTVPAGRYAAEILQYYKLSDVLKDKLVYTENVRQALDYAARGEVDAGVVYSTDAIARMKEVRVVAIAPGESHKPVVYPIALVKGTKNEKAARDFIAVVTSPEGKRILESHGFKAGK
jgi:molybdate transport system substrate-binding protein